MSRLLCLGDTQLGVGGRLDDQESVLWRIADLALARDVDVILHGGDVFEGPHVTPEQLDLFARFVTAMRDAGVPVLAISGNGKHDCAMRAPGGLGIFAHVPGVGVHTTPGVSVLGGVAIACLPWVHPGRLVASRGGGDRDEVHADVAELLLAVAGELREECERVAPDAPAVLLAHWSISGASLPTGLPVDAMREPILPLGGLAQLRFDAIVGSHIHKPQFAHGEILRWYPATSGEIVVRPTVIYTGSPQPHNHGESGYEHGVWLVELSPVAATAEFMPIESRRFVTLEYIPSTDELPGYEYAGGAIVRLRYTVTREEARRIDNAELKRALFDAGAHAVTIEPTIAREHTARIEGLDETLTELDALELFIGQHTEFHPLADAMRDRAAKYLSAVAA